MSQITCQHKDKTLGHSLKHPSKRSRHTYVVLLHRKLYLNLNRHIRHCRALTNIVLWSRVHKIATGVRQKAECLGKPWSFEKTDREWKFVFWKQFGFIISATFRSFKSVWDGAGLRPFSDLGQVNDLQEDKIRLISDALPGSNLAFWQSVPVY